MPHYNFTEVTILYRESVPKRWEIRGHIRNFSNEERQARSLIFEIETLGDYLAVTVLLFYKNSIKIIKKEE